MGKAEARLYSRARHILRAFTRENIPCVGIAGTHLIARDLDISRALGEWFRDLANHQNFEQGVKLLHTAEHQLRVLTESEEGTRDALAEWCELIRSCRGPLLHSFHEAAHACERGMDLVRSQVLETAGLQFSSPDPINYRTIDDIVAVVLQESRITQSEGGHVLFQRIADVIYKQRKLRSEPFEWVYEGLQPLLIPEALGLSHSNEGNRKIAPAALAITITAVARRLGLRALPFPASDASSPTFDGSTYSIPDLSPLLAARLASARQQGAVPSPDPWVVGLFEASPEFLDATFLDAAQGDILSGEQVCARHPILSNLCLSHLPSTSVLSTWQSLCRTVLVAHQRRGESDAVAQWLFVLLSLDPTAAEWDRALAGAEV
jgi:hypothetical protein